MTTLVFQSYFGCVETAFLTGASKTYFQNVSQGFINPLSPESAVPNP
jgi:hypothetical protein